MLADDCYGLGRRNVVARAPVFLAGDRIEVLFDNLFSPRQSLALPAEGDCRARTKGFSAFCETAAAQANADSPSS